MAGAGTEGGGEQDRKEDGTVEMRLGRDGTAGHEVGSGGDGARAETRGRKTAEWDEERDCVEVPAD